jgi:hypothetical protein
MAIIYSYPSAAPTGTDKILGVDTSDNNKTVVYTVDSLRFGEGSDANIGALVTTGNATIGGDFNAKAGTSSLRRIVLDNLQDAPSSPTYSNYRPSQYITFPAVTNTDVAGSTGIGAYALQSEQGNTSWWTRGHNTAIGTQAGEKITTGSANVAIGHVAMGVLDIGSNNVAIGNNALAVLDGDEDGNVAIGYTAMWHHTSGNANVAIGSSAGVSNASGSRTDGNTCIFLGGSTKGSADGTTNETVIGFGATGAGTNTVRLGASNVTKVETSGDFETDAVGKGFILKSPDGTRYRITVANGGALSASAV